MERARWGFLFIVAGAYISIIAGVILDLLPITALFVIPAAILGIKAVKGLFENYKKSVELIPSIKATILCHLATGLGLIVIFLIS